jgi:hypothetical protein
MPSTLEAEETIQVGHETLVSCNSPVTNFGVFFEDDGETGYFYGLDTLLNEGDQILDALHIYNVRSVVDKEKPSLVQIVWSEDGLKAALYINDYPHAVFDFAARRGYCRTNFPSPNEKWTNFDKEWSDAAIDSFRRLPTNERDYPG